MMTTLQNLDYPLYRAMKSPASSCKLDVTSNPYPLEIESLYLSFYRVDHVLNVTYRIQPLVYIKNSLVLLDGEVLHRIAKFQGRIGT